MIWMITILLFLIVLLFFYVLIQFLANKQAPAPATARLEVYKSYEKREAKDLFLEEELAKPLRERLMSPLWHGLGEKLGNLTPQATYAMFEEKLAAAGGFYGMSTNSFLLLWLVIALVSACGCGLIAGIVFRASGDQIIRAVVIGFVIAMLLPILILNQRIRARRAAMQKSLPGVLDLIHVSVQAGLPFDGAIAKVAEKMRGPLVEEFARMLQEIRMGTTRKDALKNLSDRCKVQDVSLFTAALIQADQLGVGIANVLKIQASNVRTKRQLTIREQALKAPVKILIPLVFFVFPAMFVVLLGPAAIIILRQFLQR